MPDENNDLGIELPYLGSLPELAEEDLADLIAAIQEGAETPAEALGITPEALNAIEQIAQGYYSASLFPQAAKVFGFVLRLDDTRATAYRGLGACCHAQKSYALAVKCYEQAVLRSPRDFVSWIFMGECLCHLGLRKEGVSILQTAVDKGAQYGADPLYLTRARAIVAAKGGVPGTVVLKHQGETPETASTPTKQGAGPGSLGPSGEATRPITLADIKSHPALHRELQELARMVQDGQLTFAQVGGFSAEEMDGAYVCACKYVELADDAHALQILGWLVFLNPRDGRYYQLLGIIMQRSAFYDAADTFYEAADHYAPGDPMTLIYRGEARIMNGDRDEGIRFIRAGLECLSPKPEHEGLRKRGEALIKQFADPPEA